MAAAVVHPIHQEDSLQHLATRLADPKVAASLDQLLSHADVLALLVVGLDGLLSRGETISESLAAGVSEMRAAGTSSGLPSAGELGTLLQRLVTLTGPLTASLPALEQLLTSDLADPRVIDTASMASRAIVKGTSTSRGTQVGGIWALLRALRDEDVSRALGFVLGIAKALGQELRTAGSASRSVSSDT